MRAASILAIGSLAFAYVAMPTSAAEPVPQTYLLSMKLSDGDRVVGTPRLTALAGEQAQVEIGEADGSHYSLRFTMMPQAVDSVSVRSSIYVAPAGGVHRTVNPALVVKLGEASAIQFGEDSPTAKPFRVDFTVERTPDKAS